VQIYQRIAINSAILTACEST